MYYMYPNGDEIYVAEAVYICRHYQGVLKVQDDEAIEQQFFDLEHLPVNISPLNIAVIKELKENVNNGKV